MKPLDRRFPLNVLVIGEHIHSSGSNTVEIMRCLRENESVRSFGNINKLWAASGLIMNKNVNTIFIDPLLHAEPIEKIVSFIFGIRSDFPHIVFVICTSSWILKQLCKINNRFEHYLYYDNFEKQEDISNIIRRCEEWHQNLYQYDIAISFAGEDRDYARELSATLTSLGATVFFDEYEQSNLLGKDLYVHLSEVYREQARFCVILVSQAFAKKMWTLHERRAAQDRALKQRGSEYILPIRLDDTPIPGLLDTIAFATIKEGIPKIADIIADKLWIRDPSVPKGIIGMWLFEKY